ncbi:MAG: EF-P lysine aminoacylase EpmA [Chloroflexota bacterium]
MIEDEQRRLIRIKPNLQRRALINQFTRTFFQEQGFLEVETPIRMSGVAPELYITPFQSEDWFLSTSPELYMKRLLAAGYERLFQISHCFRKGEQGRWHNCEFTMLEWYRTGADYAQMLHDTEELVMTLVNRLKLNPVIKYRSHTIDLTLPWPRITVRNAFRHAAGWDPTAEPDSLRFDTDLVTKVIPSFDANRPTVLLDYPATMASLARLKPGDPSVAERAEIFIGGLELANAYSELKDSKEQERRFRKEIEQIQREEGRTIGMPLRFLEAVAHLPECGGIALGMDRLAMLFCNADSIEEVVAFTTDTA